jgi:hypothetical protein
MEAGIVACTPITTGTAAMALATLATRWTFGPVHCPAESSPALLEALHVVGRLEVRNEFVAELPDAIRQVVARGDGGEERDSVLHGHAWIPVYETRPLEHTCRHSRPKRMLVETWTRNRDGLGAKRDQQWVSRFVCLPRIPHCLSQFC